MRRIGRVLVSLLWLALLGAGGLWLMTDPRSPLPDAWNPITPLDVSAPPSWLTQVKLRAALATSETCIAALEGHAEFQHLDPLHDSDQCYIDPRLRISSVGLVALEPLETTCAVALRLAMWERHTLRVAAATVGQEVTALRHQSSYNCRRIRTPSGDGRQMSSHATAEAIDIRGVVLTNGQRLDLLQNWQGESTEAQFFRTLRDGACRWFVTVLGPEFNRLHADHFHFQSTGWGACR